MRQHPWFSGRETGLIQLGRPFIKMHGLRNDFVIVDGRETPYKPSVEEIVRICARYEGVGCDTLLVVEQPRLGKAYASVRIFNPDGLEVEACGNASRCLGWLLLKECTRYEVRIEPIGGVLTCHHAGE